MFERFTERARQVVVLAQEETREHGAGRIDTIAILLGLLREEEGLAARVLASLDVTIEAVRDAWPEFSSDEPLPTSAAPNTEKSGQVPFSVQGKDAFELALREALSLGHNYIGTEHILLGLTRREVFAVEVLQRLGADPEKIRDEVTRALTGSPEKARAERVAKRLESGVRAYEVYVHALATEKASGRFAGQPPVAWEFLGVAEKQAWIAVAAWHEHGFELAA